MVRKLLCPGTGIQVLGERTHERKGIQRNHQTATKNERVARSSKKADVKLLDPVDHFPKIAGLHRLHLGKGQFQILERHPALCHKSRRPRNSDSIVHQGCELQLTDHAQKANPAVVSFAKLFRTRNSKLRREP